MALVCATMGHSKMTILSDNQIHALITEPKRIPDGLRPIGRLIERNQHRRKEIEVTGEQGSQFIVALRISMINPFDFSAILGYRMPGVNTIFRLRRYNGKSHIHTNTIEDALVRGFHIHTATERYQVRRGSKEDSYAEATNRYWNLESAIDCLINDCGFSSPINESPLFSGMPYEN